MEREIPHQGEEKRGSKQGRSHSVGLQVIANSGLDCCYQNPQLPYNLSSLL